MKIGLEWWVFGGFVLLASLLCVFVYKGDSITFAIGLGLGIFYTLIQMNVIKGRPKEVKKVEKEDIPEPTDPNIVDVKLEEKDETTVE